MNTQTSRRAVVKGAAWTVPVVAVASAAPAVAASQTGKLAAGPWYNTWPGSQDVNGDHGGLVPYIIMGTTDTSGAASYDQTSARDTTWGNDGTGAYECDPAAATTPYGVGDTITITITENLGTYYGDTPVETSEPAPGPAAWPDLIIRDVGMYTVQGYNGQVATDAALYGEYNGTNCWTWTVTMAQDIRPCSSDPVTFDLRMKSQGLNEDGSQRLAQYTITVTSPWGTVTQEIPAQG
ncbi:hypothetical protein [Kytococcus sp. HMSC28H12]|uniref:hypothetical protein n=1 Tax=Kytococcus sp. HMSC28H12 TaxID=1581067 RepID=UPI0008A36050|nr:hypothetical protein [Kytococcus sp. HMSC28H12]OFS13074.1 hypothetical protein HMPREF3099_06730 [Kytococcus sp. HMSC28H12]